MYRVQHRVVAEPITVVLPDSHHTTSLMTPTGLLTSSWIHLLIIDACISKHSVYLRCQMYYLFDLHTASIARLSVLGLWGFLSGGVSLYDVRA